MEGEIPGNSGYAMVNAYYVWIFPPSMSMTFMNFLDGQKIYGFSMFRKNRQF